MQIYKYNKTELLLLILLFSSILLILDIFFEKTQFVKLEKTQMA